MMLETERLLLRPWRESDADGNEKSKRVQEKCGFTFHHTEEGVDCSFIGDVRTEIFTYLSREKWSPL